MPWVQQIPAGITQPAVRFKADRAQQAMTTKIQRRRRWMIFSLIQFLVLGLVATLLLAWQRDQRALHATLERMNKPLLALQESVDRWHMLPATLPVEVKSLAYVGDADRYYAMNASEPVIIAFTPPTNMVLKADGRGVLFYQRDEQGRGRITSQWMSTAEFYTRWTAQEKKIREAEQERAARPLDLP